MARPDVLRAARRFCLECQGDSAPAVRACGDRDCALWTWRLPPEGGSTGGGSTFTAASGSVPVPAPADLAPADLASAHAGALVALTSAATASACATVSSVASAQGVPAKSVSTESACAEENAALRGRERAILRRAVLRAIRGQCMACAGGRKDVRACSARQCPLWSLRFGVLPETYKAVRARFFAPRLLPLFA